MQAVILSIGDELTLGQTVDTNTAYLAGKLAALGVKPEYHQTLADDLDLIAEALVRAAGSARIVLVTGGLGPTKDDLTRQALAKAMGVELIEDAEALREIQTFFTRLGREMAATNRVQALLPAGAKRIPNPNGTAPGIRATLKQAEVFVMPGVPVEMRMMYDDTVGSAVAKLVGHGRAILTTKVNTFGLGESSVGQRLTDLMDRHANPTVGTTVAKGIVSVRIRSEFADRDEAQAKLDARVDEVTKRLGAIVFGRDEQTVAGALIDQLREAGLMIATAESCTGGLIGTMLTDIAGSSDVYAGGWVTYTNQMKREQLGVPGDVLDAHGAVSGETVSAMATGALAKSQADIAVSVSGIAGPGGGTDDKPLGTVWIGIASNLKPDAPASQAVCCRFPGNRQQVRNRAAMCALQLARLHLQDQPLTNITWITETHE